MPNSPASSLVISYLTLRRAIGYIGIFLPPVLAVGELVLHGPQSVPSISAYYYTVMRDVLVGMLCAIGVFLLSYRGYEPADNRAGNLACFFAIGVALFPTSPAQPSEAQSRIGLLHYGMAAAFFLTLAYFCLVLFRKTNKPHAMTRRKLHRNRIYSLCGYGILLCMLLLLAYHWLPHDALLESLDPVFLLETAAIELFGLSWLVKGEAILADGV